jgi:DNA-binding transcriptional regulator YdaS (Cro superfamily)
VLSFALTILIGLALLVGLNFFGAGMATLLLLAVLSLVALFMQMSWVSYLYRSSLTAAALFYVALLVIHAVLISLVAPIFLSSPVHMAIANYVDQSVTPRLRQEAEAVRRDAAMTSGPAAAVKAQAAELEARISQARTEQQNLQEAIKVGKDSADVVFDRLVKLRAEGSLAEARAQFAAFLQWFPNGPRAETARGQLSEIDKALAAQAELKQEQQADADRAAAAARARLLARAAAGQVTLSEMRAALLGKTPAEVNALFGAPTETASNRWGYGQRMIFNALDNTHLGLTVVFADGVVQGVDYYYGSAP